MYRYLVVVGLAGIGCGTPSAAFDAPPPADAPLPPDALDTGLPPGSLDPTFYAGGKQSLSVPEPLTVAVSLAIYPPTSGPEADKIVVGAEVRRGGPPPPSGDLEAKAVLYRLDANGSIDSTFAGGTGEVIVDLGVSHGFGARAVAVDSLGRVVLVARHVDPSDACTIYVARFTAAGVADPTFTIFDGAIPGGGCATPAAVAILPGDKIAVVASLNHPDGSIRAALLQLASDGTLDTAAFTGGTVVLDNPDATRPSWLPGLRLLVDGAGRFVIIGSKCEGGSFEMSACEAVIGRITASGAWDTSFGTSGYAAFFATGSGAFRDAAFTTSGDIVAAGSGFGATIAEVSGADGSPVTAFGTNGTQAVPLRIDHAVSEQFNSVAVDHGQNLVLAGFANQGDGVPTSGANVRTSSTGGPDSTYGMNGVEHTDGGRVPRAALQSDDRLIVAAPSNGPINVFRFLP